MEDMLGTDWLFEFGWLRKKQIRKQKKILISKHCVLSSYTAIY